jgi:hypothetical protein
MQLPRVQITIWRIMVWVAVAALISLVASNPSRHDGITDERVVIPVAAAVAAVYGLGAMRRPLMSLLPLLAVWIAMSWVNHPRPDVINVSAAGCYVAWIIGATVGWRSPRFRERRRRNRLLAQRAQGHDSANGQESLGAPGLNHS